MKYLYVFPFVILILAAVCAFWYDKEHDAFSQACEARGGKAVFLENEHLCLDKDVFR